MDVELSRTYPVRRKKGYEYFMDLSTWNDWTTLEVLGPESTPWREPGDAVNYRWRTPIAGAPLRGSAVLDEVVPEELVTIRLRMQGLADTPVACRFDHAGPGAFTLTLSVHTTDPPGFFGGALQQIIMMESFIERDMRKCLDGLERALSQPQAA